MGEDSKIQWTNHTFNAWIGCTKVSPACDHCYAESMAKRAGWDVWGDDRSRKELRDAYWKQPLRWNRDACASNQRARVFCSSLADVFEDRPELVAIRDRLFGVIDQTPALDWQLLTKRPQNVVRLTQQRWGTGWPQNVWLGCTVEDQQRADERLPHLMAVPATVRFLSCEPLLGPMNLFGPDLADTGPFGSAWIRRGVKSWTECGDEYDVELTAGVDWVIVGGESGGGSRAFDLAWAQAIVAQCRGASVPVFCKQMGDKPRGDDGPIKLRTRKGGDPAEWPPGDWPREFPTVSVGA